MVLAFFRAAAAVLFLVLAISVAADRAHADVTITVSNIGSHHSCVVDA